MSTFPMSAISGLSDAGAASRPNGLDFPGMQSEDAGGPPLPPGTTPMATQSPTAQAAGNPPAPIVAKPGQPHAGLVNMLGSLFLGMDAFAKAAATGGKEGGAQEVEAVENERKQMALKQAAGAREQSQSDAMIKHTHALTNTAITQLEILKMNAT